ncbi:hypothetical protein [Clostridium sp.]|uniref:hypothetical protein n=1 Tax=Clostridium sp. TaxID=1506 RepID=UPI002FCC2C36
MKVPVPDYLKEFKCIASRCEDTCCDGWEIVIDDETYNKIEKVQEEFDKDLEVREYMVMEKIYLYKKAVTIHFQIKVKSVTYIRGLESIALAIHGDNILDM